MNKNLNEKEEFIKDSNNLINIYENKTQEDIDITEYDILDLLYQSEKYINNQEVLERINKLSCIYDNNLQEDYDITEYDILDLLKRVVEIVKSN